MSPSLQPTNITIFIVNPPIYQPYGTIKNHIFTLPAYLFCNFQKIRYLCRPNMKEQPSRATFSPGDRLQKCTPARMAESVDALVSNTSGAIRAGSIPAPGTGNPRRSYSARVFCFSDLEIGLIWSRFDSTLHKGDHIFCLCEEALTDSNCQFY